MFLSCVNLLAAAVFVNYLLPVKFNLDVDDVIVMIFSVKLNVNKLSIASCITLIFFTHYETYSCSNM